MSYGFLNPAVVFTKIVLAIYGIHHAEHLTPEQIARRAERQHFKTYTLDTTMEQCLKAKMTKDQVHDYVQPLQYWEYENGSLVWGQINCLTQGFPNLKWDIAREATSPADTTAYVSLSELAGCFGHNLRMPQSGRVAIVVWTSGFGRQNKRFLRAVRQRLVKHPEIKAYYFNADNLFKEGDF